MTSFQSIAESAYLLQKPAVILLVILVVALSLTQTRIDDSLLACAVLLVLFAIPSNTPIPDTLVFLGIISVYIGKKIYMENAIASDSADTTFSAIFAFIYIFMFIGLLSMIPRDFAIPWVYREWSWSGVLDIVIPAVLFRLVVVRSDSQTWIFDMVLIGLISYFARNGKLGRMDYFLVLFAATSFVAISGTTWTDAAFDNDWADLFGAIPAAGSEIAKTQLLQYGLNGLRMRAIASGALFSLMCASIFFIRESA